MRSPPTPRSRSLRADERLALGGLMALFVITWAWWLLALWPVADAPPWLERTRAVCFGVVPGGLPDAGGWIGLVGSPLGMLVLLLAGWGDGVRSLFRRARTTPPLAGVLAALGAGALLLPLGGLARVLDVPAVGALAAAEVALPAADHPRLDREAPDLVLVDHEGATRSLDDLRGRAVLLTFAYGHCQTVCPVVVRDVIAARAAGPPSSAPAILVVTVDPWRDVPSRLRSIADAWDLPDDDAWVLGGEIDAVEATLDAWGIPRQRDERTGEITHPAVVYVIDASGRIAFASTAPAGVLADLVRRH